jgi:roadblock/LC7 domain-containing protein
MLVMAALAVCTTASAQIPHLLDIQGRLTDSAGVPVDGQHDLTFAIYAASTGGTALWAETHANYTVDEGLFNVVLGEITPIDDALFQAEERWLGITVDTDPEISPRQRMTAVPWALRSATADSALSVPVHNHDLRYFQQDELQLPGTINTLTNPVDWTKLKNVPSGFADGSDDGGTGDGHSLDASDGDPVDALYVGPDGDVGIGTTAPGFDLDIRGSGTDDGKAVQLGNSDETHFLRFFSGRSGDPNPYLWWKAGDPLRFATDQDGWSEKMRITSDGKVGIGNAIPTRTLEVAGDIGATAYYGDGSNLTGISATPDADWTISGSDMYSGVTGNVGIGTASPANKLDVRSSGPDDGAVLGIGNSDQSCQLTIYGGRLNDPDPFIHWTDVGSLRFTTDENGWSEKMRITRDGDVGIGTQTPTRKLDVAGDVAAATYYGDGSNLTGITAVPDADWTISGSDMYAGVTGNVGIGASSPLHKLDVRGAGPDEGAVIAVGNSDHTNRMTIYGGRQNDPDPFIHWTDGGSLRFTTDQFGWSEKMRITSDGNVGIGTPTPEADLDVRGFDPDNGAVIRAANSDGSHKLEVFSGRQNDPNPYVWWKDGDPLRFATDQDGWSEKMRIASDGKVGVGTETPDAPLHVRSYETSLDHVLYVEYGGYDNGSVVGSAVHGVFTPPGSSSGIGGRFEGRSQGVIGEVYAQDSGTDIGVTGLVNAYSGVGDKIGVHGTADGGSGTGSKIGVSGLATGGGTDELYGVQAYAHGSSYTYGVYAADDGGGYAGYFDGLLHASSVTSSVKAFKIDHPLDPENSYLYHSSVESPEMKNVYDGVAYLDGSGEAWVELPEWFEALNRDFRYQLTAIGAPGPDLYIADKISGNRFRIAGGRPGMEVSWQVTGIRHDPAADAHRIQVEVTKPERERGKYLDPEAYGVGEQSGMHYELRQGIRDREAR